MPKGAKIFCPEKGRIWAAEKLHTDFKSKVRMEKTYFQKAGFCKKFYFIEI